RVDYRDEARTIIFRVDVWHRDVEQAGLRRPLRLFDAGIGGIRRAARTVEHDLAENLVRVGVDERYERRDVGIVRGRQNVVIRIICHFVDAQLYRLVGWVDDRDGIDDFEQIDIDNLQRAVT